MPQLGETVTEGTVTKWHKQVGDEVAEDEVLFEVSTDKVDSEVPSPLAGVVTEILVAEGETVPVGTRLAVVSPADEAQPAAPAGTRTAGASEAATAGGAVAEGPEVGRQPLDNGAGGPQAAEPAGQGVGAAAGAGSEASGPATSTAELSTAEAPPAATRVPGSPASAPVAGKPPVGGASRPGGRPADQRPPSAPSGGGPSKLLSPVVRRLIAEHGLDPAQIPGTGAGGRITRDDVLAAIAKQGGNGNASGADVATAPPSLPRPATGAARPASGAGYAPPGPAPERPQPYGTGATSAPTPQPGLRDTVVPFTNIRRRTAEHMVRSKHTSAHTMVSVEVDYSAVERARLPVRERFKAAEGFSLTYLPFVARAVVDALHEWPYLNSSVGEDELIVHGEVNLGVAVDIDFEGLLVPVVHRAEEKRLVGLARDIADLASRARSKRLTMDDISGGTFTITNAGGFGTFITVPVINQPQVAILSTDGVRKRPVVVEMPDGTDAIVVRPVGNLVLSWDHRAVDGAYAAAFMAKLREILEGRDWAAEL
jgi:pyruvate dehydrogenase E2 component (dihydrolipoamide acetyltransferase)